MNYDGREMMDYTKKAVMAAKEALIWSETDEEGNPLDEKYDRSDLALEINMHIFMAIFEMLRKFYPRVREVIDAEQFGHDFILTRNGHGAGFWDKGLGSLGEDLTDYCNALGSLNLYIDHEENKLRAL